MCKKNFSVNILLYSMLTKKYEISRKIIGKFLFCGKKVCNFPTNFE